MTQQKQVHALFPRAKHNVPASTVQKKKIKAKSFSFTQIFRLDEEFLCKSLETT